MAGGHRSILRYSDIGGNSATSQRVHPLSGQVENMKVCVIGAGSWGSNLIRTFSELGALGAIFDDSPERTASQAAKYDVAAVRSLEDAISSGDHRGVVIATPAETHFSIALAALKNGKDVFVEKPMTLHASESVELIRTAEQHGAILMVGHLLKYHPAIARLRELVLQGDLGRIEYVYSNRLNLGKVRREENALWSFAPHDISIIQYLLGDRSPIQVSATGGAYLQPNIADVTVSNLLFDGGTRAHIFVSWLHPFKEQKLVVIGSRAMAVFDDVAPENKLMLFNKDIDLKDGQFVAAKSTGVPVPLETAQPLKIECAHFISCMEKRTRPLTDGYDGLRVISVLEACQRSLQLNGEPVQVNPGTQLGITNL